MHFSILWLLIFVSLSFAQTVKVQGAVGEVQFQKKDKSDWQPAKVGLKLKQADKIRTGVESQATLLFENGSVVNVAENTVVALEKLQADAGADQVRLGVKTGKVIFNVRKLASGKSSFEFQARSATAAIRGTEGEFQVSGRRTLASLISGHLQLTSEQGSARIQAGQLVLQTSKGFKVFRIPEDRKVYLQLVEQYLADTTQSIENLPPAFDSLLVSLEEQKSDSSSYGDTVQSSCSVDPVITPIAVAQTTLSGKAPANTEIFVENLRAMADQAGLWKLNLAWDASQSGIRKYQVYALNADQKVPCGEVALDYQAGKVPLTLKLLSPNPQNICRGPLTLQGSYSGSGARLFLKIMGKTVDLSNLDGQFQWSMPVSDQDGNWDLQDAQLVLAGPEENQTLDLQFNVDRSCRGVNQQGPTAILTAQTNECRLLAMAGNLSGEEGIVSLFIDGAEKEQFTATGAKNYRTFAMSAGTHSYLLQVVDQAGNRTEAKLAAAACWPDERFEILLGSSQEVLRMPPPPPGRTSNFHQKMDFKIRISDYTFLKRVLVRLNGTIVQEWKEMDILSKDFQVALELQRKKKNIVTIEVESKAGRTRLVQKEYVIQ